MYTTVIRQYEINGQIMSYAEHYKGDEKTGKLLAANKLHTEFTPGSEMYLHQTMMAEAGALCGRIAQNFDEALF